MIGGQRPPHPDFAHRREAERIVGKGDRCPFGCRKALGQIDDKNICKHVVGTTSDGIMMEPLKPIYIEKENKAGVLRKVDTGHIANDGGNPEPILETDRIVKLTQSSIVYRESGRVFVDPNAKPKKEPQGRTQREWEGLEPLPPKPAVKKKPKPKPRADGRKRTSEKTVTELLNEPSSDYVTDPATLEPAGV